VAFVLLAMQRRRRTNVQALTADAVTAHAAKNDTEAGRAERQALVRAVAELDERFAAGALDEASYRAERNEQKARLVALARTPTPAEA
jgi:hypothetical protein